MKADTRTRLEADVRRKHALLSDSMNERVLRRWAAAEAEAIGHGGVMIVHRATGIARSTIGVGMSEIRGEAGSKELVAVRRKGGGRKRLEATRPDVLSILETLVDPVTRGDPMSLLRWTCKSTRALADELFHGHGIRISHQKVASLLREAGYGLQAVRKTVEGAQHPDRNAQFENISAKTKEFLAAGAPVISVDTKKKELVGNFKNAGREWMPDGQPELVDVHDFPSDAVGKAIPYGVYDVADNSGFVNVGTDHDTPLFAVKSIEAWWKRLGRDRYPNARDLFITADAGGSNGYRSHVWKSELQSFADRHSLAIHVSHFPPGTSKWNKVEHRLFSFITINWRGRPLRTYETVVNLIGGTTTREGLLVCAALDRRRYATGKRVSAAEMRSLNIERHEFHGEWNYSIRPRERAHE